jgi:hypothetical protein
MVFRKAECKLYLPDVLQFGEKAEILAKILAKKAVF